MNPYINLWLNVIDGMQNDNTYKLAWGRALIECCHNIDIPESNEVIIHFDQISEYFLKYYWNQTYFFKLYQGPARSKPVVQRITEELIDYYETSVQSNIPVWFDIAKSVFNQDKPFYLRKIHEISNALKKDVCWRFLIINNEEIPLYVLDKKRKTVVFKTDDFIVLKDYSFVLSQLLNYRWAQLLEKFNQSPRIALKVKGSTDEKIRRSNLGKFKVALLKQFPDGNVTDFYTGDLLDPHDISIDHVIPWSFMYSDDIWNLVITSKSKNSSKSNNRISQVYIEKLKARNEILEPLVSENYMNDLFIAREHDFVNKFYFQFKI